ncbi:MAG: SdpI family protein [Flavobacteriaceae bacterium]
MKSQESWNFAQKFSGKISLLLMVLTLIIQCILFLIFGASAITDLATIGLWLLAMGILIVVTERKLKIINKKGYQQGV